MSRHQPVVTQFRIRGATYPDGHWMNRFWGPLVQGLLAVCARIPFHRHILRAHPETRPLLGLDKPLLFACTHQDVFDCFNGLPRLLQRRPLAAMVSYSRDGGLAAKGLQMMGYDVVRGSSSRGGGEGLLMLRSSLNSGTSVVMVADGPKAPLGDVKPGVVRLAASAGVPIVPIRAWGLNQLRLWHSWTRAAITLPFLPIVVCFGAPIRVPEDVEDTRPFQLAVARSIADMATAASVWANGPPRPPFTVAEG